MKKWIFMTRYRIARLLGHASLIIMPESHYKRELLELMWELNRKVHATVAAIKGGE